MPAVRDYSLTVHAGEIVGVAGVSGNGQRELVEVLAGQRKRGGGVAIDGSAFDATRAQIRKHKVQAVAGSAAGQRVRAEHEREREHRPARLRPTADQRAGAFVSKRRIREKAEDLIRRFGVKTTSHAAPIGDLSGGNIQRAVLARELSASQVLIAAEPVLRPGLRSLAEIRAQSSTRATAARRCC